MLRFILGTYWTTFVFMSMLKSDLYVKCQMLIAYVDPWNMLNNFCFHVYAQKWVFVIMSHVTCHMYHVTWLMSNAYVDPWDMLNNFCFHVYAQNRVFVISMSHFACHNCHMSHITLLMLHVICQMPMLILGTWGTTFVFMSMLKSHCL